MPTPRKSLDLYPEEYRALFERVIFGTEEVCVKMIPEEANRLRKQLYAFRDALFAFGDPLASDASSLSFIVTDLGLVVRKKKGD